MAGKLDQLLVIDLESTCWEGPPPDGEEKEIIEIGVCALDITTGERVKRQSILVRPERSRVSPFCTELTHLTQAQVEQQGVSFGRACAILRRKYNARDRIWASFGDYDRRQFEDQCADRRVQYPFGPSHINVKMLFALFNGLPQEIGLVPALDLMQLPVDGVHHRGIDDAWNTARLLWALMEGCRGERPGLLAHDILGSNGNGRGVLDGETA